MKIAYLTNCFGIQSHTFIRREVTELGGLGIAIELFGIRKQVSDKLTIAERALVESTIYLYPLSVWHIAWLNLYWSLALPHRYWPTLWKALSVTEQKLPYRLKLLYHFLVAPSMAQQIKDKNVDHIHAHFLNVSSTIAMYASLLTGIPYSITVHSAGTKNASHIIGLPQKLRYAQFLLMISHYNIDYFDAIFPCKDKSVVVRCGMDLEQYPFKKPLTVVTQERASRNLSVVAVGRMVEKKGFQYLIEAAKILQDKGVDIELEIVGSGPLQAQLEKMTAALGVDRSVKFFGEASTEEVRTKMLGAGVVVVPSVTGSSGEMEGIPVVLMEAMALGVPVISTRHSGIPELVRHGETGFVVEERDSAALASALQDIVDSRINSSVDSRVNSSLNSRVNSSVNSSVNNRIELSRWILNARILIEHEFNITVTARQRQILFLKHHLPKGQ